LLDPAPHSGGRDRKRHCVLYRLSQQGRGGLRERPAAPAEAPAFGSMTVTPVIAIGRGVGGCAAVAVTVRGLRKNDQWAA